MNLNRKHFGKALKSYIEEKGIAKAWLAKRLGISNQSIHAAFKAEIARPETLVKYLDALGITEEELYQYSGIEVKEDQVTSQKPVENRQDQVIPITSGQLDYFIQAVKERDELQKMEIERLEKLNRAEASPVLKH